MNNVNSIIIKKNKLELIQVLRGIAALLVVMNHYPGRLSAFSHGYIGVDLFFVISGLIMVITTKEKNTGGEYAIDFIIKRFSRICPYYTIMTLVTLLVAYNAHHESGYELFIHTVKSILLNSCVE